jgi:multiple sugar transport system permease protein
MATTMQSAAPTPTTSADRRHRNAVIKRILFYVLVVAIVLFCLLPLLWVFDESVKPSSDLTAAPPTLFPTALTFHSYPQAFKDHPAFAGNIKNSVIIAGSATIIALIFGCSAAYAIARLKFPGRAAVLSIVLAISLFPQIALIGPLYVFFYNRGWIDTYQALIIPNVVFTLPLTIWILTTFFRELPRELEESAKVDGSGLIGTFFRLVLPLSAPGVFTAAILAFISAWNEFLFAVSFTTNDSVRPVTVALTSFSGGTSFYVPWGEIAAGAVVVTVPLIILVLILQRRIVAGLTAGAVKG